MKKITFRNPLVRNFQQVFNQILPWVTFLGLMIFIFLLMGLWYRWLRPDPDFLNFTANMVEILTIASFLGLQSEKGRSFVLNLDESIFFKKLLNSPIKRFTVAWGLVLIAALGLWVGSPIAAEAFRNKGIAGSEAGNYSAAVRAFNQAISLDPENAHSHYNLAVVWEALYDYESAIDEYRIALESDTAFWPTYNNLGRLLLFQRGDAEAAISVLLAGQRRSNSALGYAVLTKNLAWAYFQVGQFATASETANEAIKSLLHLREEGTSTEVYLADAYRLQAKIFTTQQATNEAVKAWQDSLGYGLALTESQECQASGAPFPQYCFDAAQWVAEAREALLNLEEKQDEK